MTNDNSRIKLNWLGSASHFFGFILLPVLIVVSIVLYILDIGTTFGSPLLFQVLSTIFSTGCGLIIAFFAIRTFILTSTWRVLFLGGGALAFGIASLLAGWLLTGSFNLAVTVSNFGVLAAAALHLLGAIQNPNKNIEANETKKFSNGAIAILFCSGIAAFFILVSIPASNGLFPAFYVSGQGYTLIRYIFSAFYIVFLIVSAVLYARLYVSSKSDFVYWYSLGLAMITLGLVAGFLGTPGDPLNWLGRIAQYVGSIYFVVAVVVTRNEARNQQKPVSQMLSEILTDTQAKLRESEQRWSTTLSSIGDAVIATDIAGRITFMNPVAEKMTGWNLKEAAKKPVTEVFNIINEQTRQKVVNPAEKVLQSGMIVSLANHTVLVRKDGTEVSIDDSGAPIQGTDGKITGVVLVFRDITERKQAEEALKESESKYRNLFVNMTEGFALCDIITDSNGKPIDYRVLEANQAWEKMTGLYSVQISGKPLKELIPDLEQYWVDMYGKVALTGDPIHIENYNKFTDRWYEIYAYSPRKGYFVSLVKNITDRKKTEERIQKLMASVQEERDRLSTLVNSIPDEVWFADTQKNFTLANPSAIHEFGFESTLNEIEVESFARSLEVYRPDGTPRPVEEAPTLRALEGELIKNEEEIIRTPATGELRYRQVSAAPVKDANGNIIGSVAVVRDITGLKKAEENLKRYTTELEASNKELESYSYSISHDLRTPLRTLDGFSEMVIAEYGDKLDETGKNYLNRIRKASQTMSQLTEDVLKLSRITRAEMHKGKVNLTEITTAIADELKASHPERQAEFSIAPDLIVNGDKSLLEILLRNLLENAWKYTSKCPDTRIEVGENRQEGKRVYFIKDNGVGFDMKYYDKLFQPFQRLHTSKDYPGTGIGLATVARVTHRHSGKIWAESEIGKGTTFYFTLE
jgi:PAS domain S-box-containing protein